MLKLADTTPVAAGHIRSVYQDPSDARLLIKVMRPDIVEARWGANGPWYRKLKRSGPYALFLREIKEYIVARAADPNGAPPIARIVGLADTDIGLGQIVERVADENGALAPTLGALVEQHGFVPWIHAALEEMLAGLLRHNVIVGDLHPWNVVYGSDSRGGPRLVIIDGFGERNVIPRCSMSRTINRYTVRKHYKRLIDKVHEWTGILVVERAAGRR